MVIAAVGSTYLCFFAFFVGAASGPPPVSNHRRPPGRRRCPWCATGVGPVYVPVESRLAVPAFVICRQDMEAADRSLAAILVPVEKLDRERPALSQSTEQPGSQRVIVGPDGAL